MLYASFGRAAALVAVLSAVGTPVLAQDGVQMIIDRGLTDDLPYTAIYPNVLQSVDDGNADTILTLRHPAAALQCDFFSVPGAADGWTAEAALQTIDVPGIESTWAPNFPGFAIGTQAITRFASGPALLYEGSSQNSPFSVPVSIVHAEAVDGGRTYAIDCLIDQAIAGDARPMVNFIIANFSTRSDGQCCIDPTDNRG